MRFLRCSQSGQFSFTKDLRTDDQIPPYAILSHTWGLDNEEVTFEDIENGTGSDKPGFRKISFCAEQARQDGLAFFWIDTCCIDKSDGAEISRSITSMFRWYRNATQCYVYLSDVSSPSGSSNDEENPRPWEPDFRKSKWFTRGWTLQELLAPASIKFFSVERNLLGDRSSLIQQINEITNISHSALQGDPLSQFSVEERLRWIEHRKTKLEEDITYSLQGIFDVYILPSYGEGKASALGRLLDEYHKIQICLQNLSLTDPRHDKRRIEDDKGGLMKGVYYWILENSEFQQWRGDKDSRLLWIKGDPGKGKTMLLCGVIDELKKSIGKTDALSFFFCQATDSRINSATAVLRGLVYLLAESKPSLLSQIRRKYDYTGSELFKDPNAWVAVSEIFVSVLKELKSQSTWLIIDALDECTTDLSKFLNFIVQSSALYLHVKWVISSRNWPTIEECLDTATQKVRLQLELNASSISVAVHKYVLLKVGQLAKQKKYDNATRVAVLHHLLSNSNDTFLWVALVCKELAHPKIRRHHTLVKLRAFPPGLYPLYRRMMDQISDSEDAEICRQVLAIVTTVYRPVTLDELACFLDIPDGVSYDEFLIEIIALCGSFLALRERTISFIHQSAKDFLLREASNDIFPFTIHTVHYNIFSRSLQVLSRTLRRDVYSLKVPGILICQVKQPDPDPLAVARYSCLYWVDHLIDCFTRKNARGNFKYSGPIDKFLSQFFLYWLEALSLMRSLSNGIVMIRKLEAWLKADESPNLYTFAHDSKRFVLFNRSIIEEAPLQLYCSALLFAPENSVVRRQFEKCIPPWIQLKPKVQRNWNALLQTLEGHSRSVSSVAFSADSSQVVSGSNDKTVRIWDAITGTMLQTLQGHSRHVNSVAFSPDCNQVISGSSDKTVRLWDIISGVTLHILIGHLGYINTVAFSPDGSQVVSGSMDKTVRLWNSTIGTTLQIFKGHSEYVSTVAFSPDGSHIASGSGDRIFLLWEVTTGAILRKFKGHLEYISSVVFSPDSRQVASSSDDGIVRLWDATTGAMLQTFIGHSRYVSSVAFSPDGSQVASGSGDETVRLWDATTGTTLQTLKGHSDYVSSVAFSPDGSQVVSGSSDRTVRLWDSATDAILKTLDGHSDYVSSVAFSPDGSQAVSGSGDRTVRLWDTTTGATLQILEGHSDYVSLVIFSPEGSQVVSGSGDRTVRLWETMTGATLQIFEGHLDYISSVAFSLDGSQVVSGSGDRNVRLWETTTGATLQILEGHLGSICSVAFSPDGSQVVSGSGDRTVRLWDTKTGAALQMFQGHLDYVSTVAFSPDGSQVVSGSSDGTVWLWDATTGVTVQTLNGRFTNLAVFLFDRNSANTLQVSDDWIIEGDTKILWLSLEYRSPTCTAIWNGNVILGHSSGRVSLFGFKEGAKCL